MSPDSDRATVACNVPPGLKTKIRVEAARQDKPMADLVREALTVWAEENIDGEVPTAE